MYIDMESMYGVERMDIKLLGRQIASLIMQGQSEMAIGLFYLHIDRLCADKNNDNVYSRYEFRRTAEKSGVLDSIIEAMLSYYDTLQYEPKKGFSKESALRSARNLLNYYNQLAIEHTERNYYNKAGDSSISRITREIIGNIVRTYIYAFMYAHRNVPFYQLRQFTANHTVRYYDCGDKDKPEGFNFPFYIPNRFTFGFDLVFNNGKWHIVEVNGTNSGLTGLASMKIKKGFASLYGVDEEKLKNQIERAKRYEQRRTLTTLNRSMRYMACRNAIRWSDEELDQDNKRGIRAMLNSMLPSQARGDYANPPYVEDLLEDKMSTFLLFGTDRNVDIQYFELKTLNGECMVVVKYRYGSLGNGVEIMSVRELKSKLESEELGKEQVVIQHYLEPEPATNDMAKRPRVVRWVVTMEIPDLANPFSVVINDMLGYNKVAVRGENGSYHMVINKHHKQYPADAIPLSEADEQGVKETVLRAVGRFCTTLYKYNVFTLINEPMDINSHSSVQSIYSQRPCVTIAPKCSQFELKYKEPQKI